MVAFGLFSLIPLHLTGVIGRTPKTGELYTKNYAINPFVEPETNKVIAVKDGWVRLQETKLGRIDDLRIETVRTLFKKCE